MHSPVISGQWSATTVETDSLPAKPPALSMATLPDINVLSVASEDPLRVHEVAYRWPSPVEKIAFTLREGLEPPQIERGYEARRRHSGGLQLRLGLFCSPLLISASSSAARLRRVPHPHTYFKVTKK